MKLKIIGQSIKIIDPNLTVSDTENVYEAEYEFEGWDGWQKTAVFEGCGHTYSVVLTSDRCKIPNEVLAEKGYIRFGVLGTKAEGSTTKRYPTVWSTKVYVDEASVGTGTPTPPTPEVYAQILANEAELGENIEELQDDVEELQAVAHSHTNKSVLDSITTSLINAWNGAVTWIGTNGQAILGHLSDTVKHVTQSDKNVWNAKSTVYVSATGSSEVEIRYITVDGIEKKIYSGGRVESVNGKDGVVVLNASDVGALPNTTPIPTKVSDLTNDTGFITKSVNDLTNYYLKTNTYTKSEVDSLVAGKVVFVVVSVLPEASIETMNKIYLIPSESSSVGNVKDEYITVDNGTMYVWEKIGSTSVDLSNYYTKAQTDSAISAHHDSSKANVSDLASVATSGNYNDLINRPVIPTKTSDLTNDGDGTNPFLTQHQSLADYSTTSQMNTAISSHHDTQKADASSVYTKTQTDTLLDDKADSEDVYTKSETDSAISGHHDAQKADATSVYTKSETDSLLDEKADEDDIPTKTSELTNDSGFLTEHQSLAPYRTSSEQDVIDATKASVQSVTDEATARQNADNGKVDKVAGKGLSTNDYDNTEKLKVADAYADKHTHSNKSILDTIGSDANGLYWED